MNNYYELLEIDRNASTEEIKKAFRELAKQLHPDIAGEKGAAEMRKLLAAYQTLSDRNRRFEYDRAYDRFAGKYRFDYRTFLRERKDDPSSQAKLVFFELLHLEEEEALSIWLEWGGLDFPLERYLDREDWMDCAYILAEELDKRGLYYEAFVLLVNLVREERRRPYFRHFMEEVEAFLHRVVRLRLRSSVAPETYIDCLDAMMDLNFSPRDEARWLRSIAETLIVLGELGGAAEACQEALKRGSSLPSTKQLRKKLKV
jgi:curved DNA-binding protein CbpA